MCRRADKVGRALLLCLALASVSALAQRPGDAEWQALLTEFESHVKAAFPTNDRHRRDIRVYCTADVTADGVNEAVIMLGTGGVSTEAMALLHLENGVPAIARWRRPDGQIDRVQLLKGASATYIADFELHLQDRAISDIDCKMTSNPNEPETQSCTAVSYVWNGQTNQFEHVEGLSKRVAGEYFSQRREQETSKYFPAPNQPRILTECGQSASRGGIDPH